MCKLVLYCVCRLCEAVTPTLTNLHPSSILDGLHSRCLDRLTSQNRLKKGDGGLEPETPDSDEPEEKPGTSSDTRFMKSSEMKTSSYQALISLPKVCYCYMKVIVVIIPYVFEYSLFKIICVKTNLSHITYGQGVPEHGAGNRINALVQYRFLFPRFSLITLVTNGAQMTSFVMTLL